jgi:hypothetical protein
MEKVRIAFPKSRRLFDHTILTLFFKTPKVFAAALRNSPGAEELAHALDVNAAADAKLKQFIANYSGSLV